MTVACATFQGDAFNLSWRFAWRSVSDTTQPNASLRHVVRRWAIAPDSRARLCARRCRPNIRRLQVVLALHRICRESSVQCADFVNVSAQDRFSSINYPSSITIRCPPTTTTAISIRNMRITPPILQAVQPTSDVTVLLRFNNRSPSPSHPLTAQLELATLEIVL